MRDDNKKHAAFAAAAEELFKRYPLYGEQHAMRRLERVEFVENARDGMYLSTAYIPIGAIFVPPDELFALHGLIYG